MNQINKSVAPITQHVVRREIIRLGLPLFYTQKVRTDERPISPALLEWTWPLTWCSIGFFLGLRHEVNCVIPSATTNECLCCVCARMTNWKGNSVTLGHSTSFCVWASEWTPVFWDLILAQPSKRRSLDLFALNEWTRIKAEANYLCLPRNIGHHDSVLFMLPIRFSFVTVSSLGQITVNNFSYGFNFNFTPTKIYLIY